MKAQGWYRDPYLAHDDRWFSDGQPTRLVRDGETERYDPPPPGPPKVELVQCRHNEAPDGGDSPRAGDWPAGSATYDPKAAFWAAYESAAVFAEVQAIDRRQRDRSR